MYCINLKNKQIKRRRFLYCNLLKQEITYNNCKCCTSKEFKAKKCTVNKKNCAKLQRLTELRKRTNKLAKLEKNRFSLFTNNMNNCYFCTAKKDHIHEIFCGRNRQNSMRYGLCLPICKNCHNRYQNDFNFNEKWHKKGQAVFNIAYPNLNFIKIFGRNYL